LLKDNQEEDEESMDFIQEIQTLGSMDENEYLEISINEKEVKEVIWGLELDKVPRPNLLSHLLLHDLLEYD
jgi:hypothetical protein